MISKMIKVVTADDGQLLVAGSGELFADAFLASGWKICAALPGVSYTEVWLVITHDGEAANAA